jgi:hypothetical protein
MMEVLLSSFRFRSLWSAAHPFLGLLSCLSTLTGGKYLELLYKVIQIVQIRRKNGARGCLTAT